MLFGVRAVCCLVLELCVVWWLELCLFGVTAVLFGVRACRRTLLRAV